MNDLREAFDNLSTFSFIIEQLQQAVNSEDRLTVIDAAHALGAFYPLYVSNFDKKFQIAWDHFIKQIESQQED